MFTCYHDIKLGNKHYVFVRTDTGRWYDIVHHRIRKSGLIPKAKPVSDVEVADIVAKSAIAKVLSAEISEVKRVQKKESAI